MLNRQVCQNCYKKSKYKDWNKFILEESDWKNSENSNKIVVGCPPEFNRKCSYIVEKPPNYCPYKLEHLLKENENAK